MKYTITIKEIKKENVGYKLAIMKAIKAYNSMSLIEAKIIVDKLFNEGVYQTDDLVYVEIIESICGDIIYVEKPQELKDPLTDVYYNGEWISKTRYNEMCIEAQKCYDMLPIAIKAHIDVYVKMNQFGPPMG